MSRIASEDMLLSVHDVMDVLGISRSFAYEVMARVGLTKLAPKCVRIRKADLDRYVKEHTEECVSISASEANTGTPSVRGNSASPPGTRPSVKRASSRTAGKSNSLIRIPVVRTKPRSPAPRSDG